MQIGICDAHVLSRSDLRLQAENVTILHLSVVESLSVLNLSSGIFVMELVTQRSAIWPIRREPELLDQDCDDFVAGCIIRKFHWYTLIFGRVVNCDVDIGHLLGSCLTDV